MHGALDISGDVDSGEFEFPKAAESAQLSTMRVRDNANGFQGGYRSIAMLNVGDLAPGFELQDQHGESVSLEDFDGRHVVLYFYPKAKTGGCTLEARAFRDRFEAFADRDVEVFGVSADPVDLIREFAEEENLPFRLLSDEDGAVARAYESIRDSGKAERNTYLIGPNGRIEAVYETVSPDTHPDELLNDLDVDDQARP